MKKTVLILGLTIFAFIANAQNYKSDKKSTTAIVKQDPLLLTVGGKDVLLSEFNAIYNKNNTDENRTDESINEYLDLYVKFKLKVREAEELGYDTLPSFKKELAGYRNQLSQPYLTDKEVTEALIKEAYERMKYEVRASHILIMVDANASAKDTLEAYNKIIKARKRILKGEDFTKVAKEVSKDPSVEKNGGDLGYFSALHMVYPFESAAYMTKVGDVSQPVRTRFGYHLIKVVDKRPTRGTIKAAHIMVLINKNDTGKAVLANKEKKINEIYEKLTVQNQDFAAVASQYSEDQRSAKKGGELPEFSAGKMVEAFENAAFALKSDGDISKPIKTPFGFHIIKRLSIKGLDSYDDMYGVLKAKVTRDSRSNKSIGILVNRIKKENGFKENINERNDFYRLYSLENIKNGGWDVAKAKKLNKVMFGYYAKDGDKLEYTQQDFAQFLAEQRPQKNGSSNIKGFINKLYEDEVAKIAIRFKDKRLPKTNKEFKLLMQEYRDGILLFDLTDKKVWSKAVKDTTGLEAFYEKNKNNYMWEERVDATLYTCSNESVMKKVNKLIKKKSKKGYSNEDMLKMINTDSQLDLFIKEGKFTKKDNPNIAKATWQDGFTSTIKNEKDIVLVVVNKVLEPSPKSLNEVRGIVTSDYQNFLEKEWVKELKSKYKVTVNKEVLKLVK